MTPHCLTIAGSDPGGGAGIQGDLKTFTRLEAYGMAVVTALTAQNTHEVRGVHAVPSDFVRLQLRTVLDDIRCDAAKTGMLANAAIIRAIAEELSTGEKIPLVVDPVMVSTSGARLLEEDAVQAMRECLMPLATIATPNMPEAGVLSGMVIRDVEDAIQAAKAIHALGARVVVVKGGDVEFEPGTVCDVVFDGEQVTVLRAPRISSGNTHGSGCALAAALAVGLARGLTPFQAIDLARRFVRSAIEASERVGRGPGPVNHLRAEA
ncbi:MAG: bifunctional hydroxymethylpyrimidine kinase/phosphomethylpyrimidine kinase [Candidatus Sumerlaeaceae bacterium]|nr:bifunctional hydroxymethylpyrimidine kinase/phosphomethylpyrimidine kinase [Candidatus Sumerlaeaceae bacterium]